MAHKSKKQWYLRKEVGKLQVCQGAEEEIWEVASSRLWAGVGSATVRSAT